MTLFSPAGATAAITLNGTTSVRVALNPPGGVLDVAYAVTNMDEGAVFVKFGDATVDATSADFPVAPNATFGIDPGPRSGMTHAAAIAPGAATGIVYITPIHADSRR